MINEELMNSLSDELKEKLKNCKSEQEMMEVLADADMEPLDDDLLEAAAGGSCNAGRSHGQSCSGKCGSDTANCNCF